MGMNVCVNVSLHNDHYLRRLWTVGKDAKGLTFNGCDEHVSWQQVPE